MPLPFATCERHMPADPITQRGPEPVCEHLALVRWLGRLQQRMSEMQRMHVAEVAALQANVVRLRGQAIVLRTTLLWGLHGAEQSASSVPQRALQVGDPQPVLQEVSAVICQVGCVGHAHAWLDDKGVCRRTKEACERLGTSESTGTGQA